MTLEEQEQAVAAGQAVFPALHWKVQDSGDVFAYWPQSDLHVSIRKLGSGWGFFHAQDDWMTEGQTALLACQNARNQLVSQYISLEAALGFDK